MSLDDLIALAYPQYNERPQLAQLLRVNGDKIYIRWYEGSWTGQWKVCTYYIGKKKVVWEEEVETKHIIMHSVKLTPAGRLSSKTKQKLQELYNNIIAKSIVT